jgi:hypothetical protein
LQFVVMPAIQDNFVAAAAQQISFCRDHRILAAGMAVGIVGDQDFHTLPFERTCTGCVLMKLIGDRGSDRDWSRRSHHETACSQLPVGEAIAARHTGRDVRQEAIEIVPCIETLDIARMPP